MGKKLHRARSDRDATEPRLPNAIPPLLFVPEVYPFKQSSIEETENLWTIAL